MKKQLLADVKLSTRRKTPQGYMVFPGSVLGRTGIQEYDGEEVGGTAGEIVGLDRPEAEVFRPDAISSFEGMPVTLNHPEELEVLAVTWRRHAVGVVINVRREGDLLVGDIWVYDQRAVDAIEREGIEELSLGYSSDLEEGGAPGAHFTQTNIQGNHVAIVPRGRCGEACRLGDQSRKPIMKLLDAVLGRLGLTKPTDAQKTQLADTITNLGVDPDSTVKTDEPPTPKGDEDKPAPKADNDDASKKADEDDAALAAANARIAQLEAQLAANTATQADAEETRVVAADAALRFPQVQIADAASARVIRERVVAHKGLYTADEAKKLTDCDLKAAYQAARTLRDNSLGRALLGDGKAEPTKVVDYNSLYRTKGA